MPPYFRGLLYPTKTMNYSEVLEATKQLNTDQLDALIYELGDFLSWKLHHKMGPPLPEYQKEVVKCDQCESGFRFDEFTEYKDGGLFLFCMPNGDQLVYALCLCIDSGLEDIFEYAGEGWLEKATPIIREVLRLGE